MELEDALGQLEDQNEVLRVENNEYANENMMLKMNNQREDTEQSEKN